MTIRLTCWYYEMPAAKYPVVAGLSVIDDQRGPYNKYLVGALLCDFPTAQLCQEFLDDIEKVRSGRQEKTGWSGNAFDITVYRDHVDTDHQQFAGHPDWPTWTCTLAEFKTALQGWKRFLEMPVSLQSELVVELPPPVARTS